MPPTFCGPFAPSVAGMNETVLTTTALTKRYGTTTVVDAMSISLQRGRIHGLIGRNGAGKTTLMRMITGLNPPTSGSLEIFGEHTPAGLQRERRRVGCLIEEPGLVGHLTAAQNLRVHRTIRGIPSTDGQDELLDLVGLGDVGRKRVRDFSLGMRQRLGIAIALVARPELLVLDEPINGLDPVGVVETRRLLQRLCAERHLTILVSSHNLPELFQTATDYLIIDDGVLRQTLTHDQLEQRVQHHLVIRAHDPARIPTVLEQGLGAGTFTVRPDGSVHLHDHLDEPDRVLRLLTDHDIYPHHFATEGDTLEGYFLSVVGGGAS